MHKLQFPITLEVIDGTMLETGKICDYAFVNIMMQEYPFCVKLFVLEHCHTDIVLGLDLLKCTGPLINRKNLTLHFC